LDLPEDVERQAVGFVVIWSEIMAEENLCNPETGAEEQVADDRSLHQHCLHRLVFWICLRVVHLPNAPERQKDHGTEIAHEKGYVELLEHEIDHGLDHSQSEEPENCAFVRLADRRFNIVYHV
jgi:hypothetical protein